MIDQRGRRLIRFVAVAVAIVLAACGPSSSDDDDDDDDGGSQPCTNGEHVCTGMVWQTCVSGSFVDTETCATSCDAFQGCTFCAPSTGTCTGDYSQVCLPDGSAFVEQYCDPVQGMACSTSGICEGPCAPTSLGDSYVGCDYWPTVTGNIVSQSYEFAVAVSNTTMTAATVTIDGGATTAPIVFMVQPQSTSVQRLPWVPALKLGNSTNVDQNRAPMLGAFAVGGAYHMRSTQPVTAYQFNPLDYTVPGLPTNSYSNDASLLLPSNAWRTRYYVASYPALADGSIAWPSQMAVTAHQAGTQVTITTKANTPAAGGAPAFVANVPQTVVLGAGDVIELTSITGDLTGTYVESNLPIEVFGAHYCTYIPSLTYGYCDHLEESMFPIDALSTRYVVVAPAVTTIPAGKEQVVRIIATEPNTTVSYDPPVMGAALTIANAGDFIEIARNAQSFAITATSKVLVSQYMEGSTVAGNTGDPSMSLAVPVEQYRNSYLFHAPTNYETNYVDIIAPTGTSVMLDGANISNFTAIGASGFSLARVTPLGAGPLGDGNHSITGSAAFGISVYGYGQDTSYWYPGGLDLDIVPIGHTAP